MTHYVRAYDPVTDIEEWHGPLPAHMAGLVAMGLEGKWQTRVYHKSELPIEPETGNTPLCLAQDAAE
jgi:hypothetical protein